MSAHTLFIDFIAFLCRISQIWVYTLTYTNQKKKKNSKNMRHMTSAYGIVIESLLVLNLKVKLRLFV